MIKRIIFIPKRRIIDIIIDRDAGEIVIEYKHYDIDGTMRPKRQIIFKKIVNESFDYAVKEVTESMANTDMDFLIIGG